MLYVLIGLLIRLSLLFTASGFDINNHIVWAKDMTIHGLAGFYQTVSSEVYCCLYPNYPPLILYIFYPFYHLKDVLFDIAWWLNTNIGVFPSKIMFYLGKREFLQAVMKLPGVLFDILLFYALFLFAKKIVPKDKKIFAKTAIFIFLNPTFIYLSALWGQVDSANLFFIVLSFYLLFYEKRPYLSAVAITFSLLVKPTVIIFLPAYFLYYFDKFGWKKSLIALITVILVFWIAFMPFYKGGSIFLFPYLIYLQKIIGGQSIDRLTNSAFNFWAIFPSLSHLNDRVRFLGSISYRAFSVIIVFIVYTVVFLKSFLQMVREKTAAKNKIIIFSMLIAAFAFIMFFTRMHERYFVYLLPWVFLLSCAEKKFRKWLIVLNIVFFLNVYFAWSLPYTDLIGKLKNDYTVAVMSLVNFAVFLKILFIFSLKKIWK